MSPILKIVVTGGGTGGHIYPGLAVISALKAEDVLYVGSRRGLENTLIPNHGIRFHPIYSRPLMGQRLLGKIIGLLTIAVGIVQSTRILLRFKPNVVLGTGGYVCLPVLLAAGILRIPTLLLEQNLLPGRTTRFLSRFVSRVLVSFQESNKYLPQGKTVVTGNPVRPEIGTLTKEESCRKLGIPSDFPIITVMGASQGARALNNCLLDALPRWAGKSWQILHLTGEAHYVSVLRKSQRKIGLGKLRYRAFSFVEEMAAVYGASDFIIGRAGATGLAEIMQAGKPSLLVPYPYAADNHQALNAEWLKQKSGCLVIPEKDFTVDVLVRTLEEVMEKPESLRALGENARRAASGDALTGILEVLKEVAR